MSLPLPSLASLREPKRLRCEVAADPCLLCARHFKGSISSAAWAMVCKRTIKSLAALGKDLTAPAKPAAASTSASLPSSALHSSRPASRGADARLPLPGRPLRLALFQRAANEREHFGPLARRRRGRPGRPAPARAATAARHGRRAQGGGSGLNRASPDGPCSARLNQSFFQRYSSREHAPLLHLAQALEDDVARPLSVEIGIVRQEAVARRPAAPARRPALARSLALPGPPTTTAAAAAARIVPHELLAPGDRARGEEGDARGRLVGRHVVGRQRDDVGRVRMVEEPPALRGRRGLSVSLSGGCRRSRGKGERIDAPDAADSGRVDEDRPAALAQAEDVVAGAFCALGRPARAGLGRGEGLAGVRADERAFGQRVSGEEAEAADGRAPEDEVPAAASKREEGRSALARGRLEETGGRTRRGALAWAGWRSPAKHTRMPARTRRAADGPGAGGRASAPARPARRPAEPSSRSGPAQRKGSSRPSASFLLAKLSSARGRPCRDARRPRCSRTRSRWSTARRRPRTSSPSPRRRRGPHHRPDPGRAESRRRLSAPQTTRLASGRLPGQARRAPGARRRRHTGRGRAAGRARDDVSPRRTLLAQE